MDISVIILAAGQGTRMKSDLPKVLHRLADKPLVQHVLDTIVPIHPIQTHLVYGHGGDRVQSEITANDLNWVHQDQQLGTGHAVQQVLPHLSESGVTLILYGDVPCVRLKSINALLSKASEADLVLLTVVLDNPDGYGRIRRDSAGSINAIVEHKDATIDERGIKEINTGIMAVNNAKLHQWLGDLSNDNAQSEYYLTDIVAMASAESAVIEAQILDDPMEAEGVNDRQQLAKLERYYQLRCAQELMRQGVTLVDPARLDIRGDLKVGHDSVIDVNVITKGTVQIGRRCQIGAQVILNDCIIGDDTIIKDQTIIEGAVIGNHCSIGPFARIRPGSNFEDDVHVGNFVETKKALLKRGTKAGHLSYLGDSEIGTNVNIGAGTITCNYDGANKHLTEIGNDVFVGSDSQLVAPVKIGNGVTIAAGTTVTQTVSENALVISRVKQREVANWKRPRKKSDKE